MACFGCPFQCVKLSKPLSKISVGLFEPPKPFEMCKGDNCVSQGVKNGSHATIAFSSALRSPRSLSAPIWLPHGP